MRLPSTFCAVLSSLSTKPPLFCVTYVLLLQNKTCHLTCVKIFLERLSNKILGEDLAPFSEKVEWFKPLVETDKSIRKF